ncbi:MAG: cytochrome c biogenesis protein CcsA, partial [Ignavibacteriales bacterium]|nr:cytochrome c biogenesis protein CcsA [Ignavibacteriales bacterium]
LNPLLQNFWMAIHPPVLFVGFAAAAVPFAFAISGLWKKLFTQWVPLALPWVLFSSVALGAGIMLGGYWAYGVLGWGGWWGWDPVENSSLIPWIVSVILLHTMIVQKKTGKFIRTNFSLAVASFTLVIYSTFLTRSGILGDASVHSFVDPGTLAYSLLILWLGTVAFIGGRLIQRRWKELEPPAQDEKLFNRQSFIGIAALVMGLSALVIFFGTSLPIVSKTTVEPAFYDSSNLPLAIAMCLLLGFSLLLRWDASPLKDFLNRLRLPLGVSLAGTAALYFFGVQNWSMVLLACASLFAFIVNLDRGYRTIIERPRYVGGAVAHIGLALLFLGIIGSGGYGNKQTASLVQGEARDVLGYQVTYKGSAPTDDGKTKFIIKAEREGQTITLEPVMFQSSYNNSIMRNPDYVSFLTRDFYIEPVSVEHGEEAHEHDFFKLEKGVQTKIGEMQVRFVRFDMGAHGNEQMMTGGGMNIGAVLEVKRSSKTEQVVAVTTYGEGKQPEPKTVMLKDGKIGFQLVNMNIDMETKKSTVDVLVIGLHEETDAAPAREMLIVEASVKPFMNLVWIGTVFALGGLFIAMLTSKKETGSLSIVPSNGKSKKKMQRVGETQIQEQHEALEEVKP